MIQENFQLLIDLTEAATETAGDVMVDLVNIWTGTGQTEVLKYIDPRDTFRGMCAWLNANSNDTLMLSFISRWNNEYLPFYNDYLAEYVEVAEDNMNAVMVHMLKTYRENVFGK